MPARRTGRNAWYALLAVALLFLAGCPSLARPPILSPGPIDVQRQQAHQFDPYPDNDIGPALVGGRPLDYERPPPEPAKARWNPVGWLRRFGKTSP